MENKKTYIVTARFYEAIEAESREEAIEKFESTGGEELTLDTATIKARAIKT